MKVETKVGIFVVITIVMLFGLTTQVGSFHFGKKDGYIINANIPDASGIELNAKVKSRGITIGAVQSFILTPNNVTLKLLINKNIKIPQGSIVSIKQESMLGVKYIDIEFSNNTTFLNINDTLVRTKHYASFEQTSESVNQAALKIKDFVDRLDKLVAKNEKNINLLIKNFKDTGAEFKQTGEMLNKKLPPLIDKFHSVGNEFEKTGRTINKSLPSILKKFDSVGSEFETTGKTINKKLPTILTKFEKLEDGIQGVIDDNRANLKSAIKHIDSAFKGVDKASESVKSSFDKLDKYLASTTKSTLGIEFKTQYMQNDNYNKTFFGLDYSPKPTRHYLVDIISTNDYTDDGTNTNTPKTTKLHEKTKTLISAQYGKDINNLRLRAGIIQSTGGLGVDYFALNRRLKFSLEAYDFNAYNDVRGDKTHLTSQLQYTMKKHILFYTGYDNFLNKDARTVYFGVGVKFEDNDLKYLLGSSGSMIK